MPDSLEVKNLEGGEPRFAKLEEQAESFNKGCGVINPARWLITYCKRVGGNVIKSGIGFSSQNHRGMKRNSELNFFLNVCIIYFDDEGWNKK